MSSIDHNPFKVDTKSPKEPYVALVGKMLGAEAQAAASRLTGRRDVADETLEENIPGEALELTAEEKKLVDLIHMEREAKHWFDEAIKIVASLSDESGVKSGMFIEIGEAQARAGLNSAESFKQAEQALLKDDEDELARSRGLIEIAEAQAHVGLDPSEAFKRAEEHVRTMESVSSQATMQLRLLEALLDSSRFEEALQNAFEIEEVFHGLRAFARIAVAMSKAGMDYEQPIKVVFVLASEINSSKAYITLGQNLDGLEYEQIRAFNLGLELARKLGSGFLEIAKAQIEFDLDPTEALDEALLNTPKPQDSDALILISAAYAEAGKIEQALNLINDKDAANELSDFSLEHLVSGMVKTGRINEADETLRFMYDHDSAYQAIELAAPKLIKKGLVEKALEEAASITDIYFTGALYVGLINEFDRQGKFDEAVKVVLLIEDDVSSRCVYLIQALADNNRVDDAIKLLPQIPPHKSENSKSAIAYALARAGRLNEAEVYASELEDAENRSKVFSRIAAGLCEAGRDHREMLSKASEAALEIQDDLSRAETYAQNAIEPLLAVKRARKLIQPSL